MIPTSYHVPTTSEVGYYAGKLVESTVMCISFLKYTSVFHGFITAIDDRFLTNKCALSFLFFSC